MNNDSELYVLGTIIDNNSYMTKIINEIEEEDFYNIQHKIIFGAMKELYKKNIPFDVVILFKHLPNGAITLTELTNIATYIQPSIFKSHVNELLESSKQRKLEKICKMVLSKSGDSTEKIDLLQNAILKLSKGNREEDKIYNMADVLEKSMESIERAYNSKNGFTGIATGLQSLDNAINGLQKKEFLVVGARPSMGKTAFSLSLLNNVEGNILYVQLDMSIEGMGQRMLSSETLLPNAKVGKGKLDDDEWTRLVGGLNKLSKKKNIFLYSPPATTVNNVMWKAKEIKAKYGLDIIIIDHIGKLKPSSKGTRYEQMSIISRDLKGMARELNISLVSLCQLSRAVEQRNDKRPMLSDLRDSGSIEEDADVIMLLYRDGYYKNDEKEQIVNDLLEVNIAKNRNGQVGKILFDYNLRYQTLVPTFN